MDSTHYHGINNGIQIGNNYGPISGDFHLSKRPKTSHYDNLPVPRHDQYTIAWICALHMEMAAARAMLDDFHEALPTHADDRNTYILGNITQHNVVIACLPENQYGTNNAAIVMTNMKRTFPAIRASLMVGIGGGVPSKADVRLGDVVVGTRVMQCDLGKVLGDGQFQRTAISRILHQSLGTLVSSIRSKHELGPSRVQSILEQNLKGQPAYSRPALPDRLFHATYDHESLSDGCDGCDTSKLVPRSRRILDEVVIHYGAIASGNQVMRDGITRDNIGQQLDVICFEMETAGLMDILPCLPIRGICDYSDSHKNKEWQRYAAATAAAFARELLEDMPVTRPNTSVVSMVDPRKKRYYAKEKSQFAAANPRPTVQCPSRERRQHLLNSLKFEQMETRKSTIEQKQKNTCRWFLSHPSHEAWLDPARLAQHHGFLWISGKPGAGKSTIMKFAYSSMKVKACHRNAITASFFFNARGECLEKTILGMYRSLLLQLLEGYSDLQIVLDDFDLISQNQNDCPSLNVLKELFTNAICALGQRSFTCFVDALDECDEQQVVDMVQYFEDLAEKSTAKGVPFRICFSSRHYPHIVIQRGLRLTLEDQLGHAEDLATYVTSRLLIKEPALIEELQPQLLGKAAGVFMWVVLVVDILNKEYRRGGMALRRRLADIPSDLSELFKDILRRDNEDMEALQLCILWILYAKNPLRPQEFHHALWSGLSLKGLVDSQIPDVTVLGAGTGDDMASRYVISSSKGLAETTKSSRPTVQFIHESVRDLLVKDKGLYELWPELGFDCESIGHEKLKQCCNLYNNQTLICASVSRLQSESTSNSRNEILNEYPFLEYATQNILHHANAAAKAVSQNEFLTSFPISSWINSSNLFEKFRNRKYTPSANLFYILADKGCPALIRTWFKDDPQVHVFGERYNYPLFAGLANGNKDAVAALLNSSSRYLDGVDITDGLNHRKDLKEYENRTPLSWAAQDGRAGIVKLLLQNRTICNEMDRGGRTPLSRAALSGHEAVARLLIDNRADVNTRQEDGRTPLQCAASNGHEAVARLLIDNGADVNTREEDGQTSLQWASSNGHEAVARLLIERGADVNTSEKYGLTPLNLALMGGQEAIARLLIEHGADTNARNEIGWTPLQWASLNGHEALVKLLIEKEADINTREEDGRTPLLCALSNGHEAVARILIGNGANIRTRDEDGRTPLRWASSNGYEAIARLLIERGADVNTSDTFRRTPLLCALSNGHEAVARLLIEHGADINTRDKEGQTPLQWALLRGHEAIAKLLIERGADVNTSDNDE
jgi:ankyrin repeat protein/nucleoside phosphorylase